eukprot:m.206009 g.206009  ORF g.206009 m.206009 type:complete len:302 (+) comp23169_c0_seq1:118-1023(+)
MPQPGRPSPVTQEPAHKAGEVATDAVTTRHVRPGLSESSFGVAASTSGVGRPSSSTSPSHSPSPPAPQSSRLISAAGATVTKIVSDPEQHKSVPTFQADTSSSSTPTRRPVQGTTTRTSAVPVHTDTAPDCASNTGRLHLTLGSGTTISFVSGHMDYEVLCTLGSVTWRVMRRYSLIHELRKCLQKQKVCLPPNFPKKEYLVPVDLDKRQEKLKVWMETLSATVDLASVRIARTFFEVDKHQRAAMRASSDSDSVSPSPGKPDDQAKEVARPGPPRISAVPSKTAMCVTVKSPSGNLGALS